MTTIVPTLDASSAEQLLAWSFAPPGRVLHYQRSSLAAGTPLGPCHDSRFVEALLSADVISADLRSPKLGDTLLGLAALQALWDFCVLKRQDNLPELAVQSFLEPLLARCRLPITTFGCPSSRLRHFRVASRDVHLTSEIDMVLDPDLLTCYLEPCGRNSVRAYIDLPARFYLFVELCVGVRLPRDRDFAPTYSFPDRRATTSLLICYIEATSLPFKKDYGRERFSSVARAISERLAARPVRHILVGARECPSEVPFPFESPAAVSVEDIAMLLSTADVVIGNDTGLTHLAALSHAGPWIPPVIGLYARHSYSKWRSSSFRHFAIATGFSEHMHARDLCPVRDQIDDVAFGALADLATIAPSLVAEFALRLLE